MKERDQHGCDGADPRSDRGSARLAALAVLFCAGLLWATGSWAQTVGLGAILNPEGSRLFPQTFTFPRHPGKPDPRWRSFDWQFIDLNAEDFHYRLYFYPEEEWTARFAIPRIRAQVKYLSELFHYVPRHKFSYVLFSSQREFQQANIFFISEGVQGVTSTTEATMAIPYWGETETFDHISTHEMVHQFQVQKINDLAKPNPETVMQQIPLWFIEGMAEYYSLRGMDDPVRAFVRDVVLYPDKSRDYVIPKFFDPGPYSFVHIYKLDQARIHFLEKTFGKGTAQRLLDAAIQDMVPTNIDFRQLLEGRLGRSADEIDRLWHEYLREEYEPKGEPLDQSPDALIEIKEAGDTLDHFAISPDGRLAAIRETDPLIGKTAIQLLELDNGYRRTKVAEDAKPGLLSLFFFQFPVIALANTEIAYVVGTIEGPELELRTISRGSEGEPRLGEPRRIRLHEMGLIQASSPALSPDARQLAFIGLNPRGWQNVYVLDLDGPRGRPELRQLTYEYYSWRGLSWSKDQGLVGSADRTATRKYNLFRIDPKDGEIQRITTLAADQLNPVPLSRQLAHISWASGSAQVHVAEISNGKQEKRLTGITTGTHQIAARNGDLYALALKSGRFRLYRVPEKERVAAPVPPPESAALARRPAPRPELSPTAPAWSAELAQVPPTAIGKYSPFRAASGVRLDDIVAFFSTGNVGGAAVSLSDLMRNYNLSAEFIVLGDLKFTNTYAFLTSAKGRSTWTGGIYHISQARLDTLFPSDNLIRTYLHREFGGLAAIQYPFGAFSYVDFALRLAGVSRSDFGDARLEPEFSARNPGPEFLAAPVLRLGYDRILDEAYTGPIEGYGVLLEGETNYFPERKALNERLRLDAAYYWKLPGRTVFALQGIAGASLGDSFKNPFYLSSDDILRAYPFGDDRLRGNYLAAAKAEVRFPIGSFFGFPPLRGLTGADYGTIFREPGKAAEGLSSSATAGVALNIPPLAVNLLWSFPLRVASGPKENYVFHFTLRYLYL